MDKYYTIFAQLKIEYAKEKDALLVIKRGIGFEEVKDAIERGNIVDDINHFNQKQYPNQRIMLVNIHAYIFAVPYVIDTKRNVIFLKTIYPDRKLTKKYLGGK